MDVNAIDCGFLIPDSGFEVSMHILRIWNLESGIRNPESKGLI